MLIKDVVKTDNILKVSPDSSLAAALSNLSSSHDAAFVFDEDKYIGVVNPYYSLIKNSNPGSTKVVNSLFHPPKLHLTDDTKRVAQLMTESKVHYLPVFDEKENFIGITSARRLLRHLKDTPLAALSLEAAMQDKTSPVITVFENDQISAAMLLFKDHRISKLIVIDENMKLRGILSYYDLIPYLVAPGKKDQRVTKVYEKDNFLKMKVKNYAKKTVITCRPENTVGDAITSMLGHTVGSVVIVDTEGYPYGLLTTRDILEMLKDKKKKKLIILSTKHIRPERVRSIDDLYRYISRYLENNNSYRDARIYVQSEKDDSLFKLSVHLNPEKGGPKVFEREGKDLIELIKDVKSYFH